MEYVIIVDDEISNTESMSENIEFEDREVLTFNNPEDFIKHIKEEEFANCKLLIVDYSMPELTGFQVYKQLFKTIKEKNNRYDVLYTGNLNQIKKSEIEFMKNNGVSFIEKPNIEKIMELAIEKVEEN